MEEIGMFEVCTKCYMPNTRPGTPFEGDVCFACKNYESRKNVDWDARMAELQEICDRHRSRDGSWDCVIPVSGGKDSHTQVYYMKELMGMNPLLITVGDPFTVTKAGADNFFNIGEAFGCDQIRFTASPDLTKRLTRSGFEEFLDPLRFIEQILYAVPFKLQVKLGIKMMLFGEAPFDFGVGDEETKSALELVEWKAKHSDPDFWISRGATLEELNSLIPPTDEAIKALEPEVYYLSYFIPWSSTGNRDIAKRYGFSDLSHEWIREGCMENFEQIDSMAYLTHLWLKYPKFGFQRTSDIAARRIREGLLTKEEAKQLILERDPVLDQLAMRDFIDTCGYSVREFWDVVERFWNTEIFEKEGVHWKMKAERFPD
jgi:N-acetyl sugar amidotransferase